MKIVVSALCLQIPIFQEPFESCHKRIRDILAHNARCHFEESIEDVLNRLILESDPELRTYEKKRSENDDPEDHPAVLLLVI